MSEVLSRYQNQKDHFKAVLTYYFVVSKAQQVLIKATCGKHMYDVTILTIQMQNSVTGQIIQSYFSFASITALLFILLPKRLEQFTENDREFS